MLRWTPYSFILFSCVISALDTATVRVVPDSIHSPSISIGNGLGIRRCWRRSKINNSTWTEHHTSLASVQRQEPYSSLNLHYSTGIRYPPRGGGATPLTSTPIPKCCLTTRQKDILKYVAFLLNFWVHISILVIMSNKPNLLNHDHLLSLLSGGVAGTIASCITNPLEVIKTQLQSSSASKAVKGDWAMTAGHPMAVARRIYQAEGIPGFFRGLPPTLIGIIPSRSTYFYAYQQTKQGLHRWYNTIRSEKESANTTSKNDDFLSHCLPEGSVGNALIAGFAAGVASNTLTNPIWMVKTRMQILADKAAGQRMYTGYADAISTIWKQEGFTGFYRGLFASYWGCTEGAVQFLLYERIKTKLLNQNNLRRLQIDDAGQNPIERNKQKPLSQKALSQRKSNNVDVTTTINSNVDAGKMKLTKVQYFMSAAIAKSFASVLTYVSNTFSILYSFHSPYVSWVYNPC